MTLTELPTTNDHAGSRMSMRGSNTLNSAHPVDLCAQSDLIGAPEPMKIEAVLALRRLGAVVRLLFCDRVRRSMPALPTRLFFPGLPVRSSSMALPWSGLAPNVGGAGRPS